ncbi:MAG: hypothetical protein V7K48_31905 [Nostoc sp.]|uniref:hypothetical protein n=1 Tax=Nostoc sp. TaxID=1180 RepID=UPI002FFC73A5
MTTTVIGVVIALHYLTKLSNILLFWLAFIFTPPSEIYLTKPVKDGGLSLPKDYASAIAFILLAVVLFFSVRKEKKVRHLIE